MAIAHVRVLNAIGGQELLTQSPFPCLELPKHVAAALGSRPSRPVTLLYQGIPIEEHFEASPEEQLELTAVMGAALTEEDREHHLQLLHSADSDSEDDELLEQTFADFSEAARDDRALVLAAVALDDRCLMYASHPCQDDKEIVLAALHHYGMLAKLARTTRKPFLLPYAGEACRDDRQIVLTAVQQSGMSLKYASEARRGDKEIALAAVRQHGMSLAFASAACRDDRDVVLAAVQQNGLSLEYASNACKDARDIVLAAVQQNGLSLFYASDARRADKDLGSVWQNCAGLR